MMSSSLVLAAKSLGDMSINLRSAEGCCLRVVRTGSPRAPVGSHHLSPCASRQFAVQIKAAPDAVIEAPAGASFGLRVCDSADQAPSDGDV